MAFLKPLLVAGVAATLATFADAHSALLANGKLLGQLNSGKCFNCAVAQVPVPSSIPASAVDPSDPEDGIGAYLKSSGGTVKDAWNAFHAGQSYGTITEPEAIKPGKCGRYSPTAVGDIPAGARISYKKSNHNGPGEIWVDDKKVWFGENFIRDGRSISADLFKCNKASCQVTWYWLGKVKVKNQWNYYQIYVQCFNIKGSGSNESAAIADDAPAPAATPKPAATPAADSPSAGDEDDAKPGTVAPPAGEDAPGSDSKEARKAAKEKRKAEKAAAKAAKRAAKNNGTSTDE